MAFTLESDAVAAALIASNHGGLLSYPHPRPHPQWELDPSALALVYCSLASLTSSRSALVLYFAADPGAGFASVRIPLVRFTRDPRDPGSQLLTLAVSPSAGTPRASLYATCAGATDPVRGPWPLSLAVAPADPGPASASGRIPGWRCRAEVEVEIFAPAGGTFSVALSVS